MPLTGNQEVGLGCNLNEIGRVTGDAPLRQFQLDGTRLNPAFTFSAASGCGGDSMGDKASTKWPR